MQIYFIIYTSKPLIPFSQDAARDLLTASRKNNQKHLVTGMLVWLPNMFIQLIEGPEGCIKQLYANILEDSRHYQATILSEGVSVSRRFGDWTMGADFSQLNDQEKKHSFNLEEQKVLDLFEILDFPFIS